MANPYPALPNGDGGKRSLPRNPYDDRRKRPSPRPRPPKEYRPVPKRIKLPPKFRDPRQMIAFGIAMSAAGIGANEFNKLGGDYYWTYRGSEQIPATFPPEWAGKWPLNYNDGLNSIPWLQTSPFAGVWKYLSRGIDKCGVVCYIRNLELPPAPLVPTPFPQINGDTIFPDPVIPRGRPTNIPVYLPGVTVRIGRNPETAPSVENFPRPNEINVPRFDPTPFSVSRPSYTEEVTFKPQKRRQRKLRLGRKFDVTFSPNAGAKVRTGKRVRDRPPARKTKEIKTVAQRAAMSFFSSFNSMSELQDWFNVFYDIVKANRRYQQGQFTFEQTVIYSLNRIVMEQIMDTLIGVLSPSSVQRALRGDTALIKVSFADNGFGNVGRSVNHSTKDRNQNGLPQIKRTQHSFKTINLQGWEIQNSKF